jgi:hypothetical protein
MEELTTDITSQLKWLDDLACRSRQKYLDYRTTLSTAHIRPQYIYYAGASLLTVKSGRQSKQAGGGRRGRIKGFSSAARLRLMRTIGKIKRDAELPLFITLTYPDKFPDAETSKHHLVMFSKRVKRAFPGIGLIWKLEPQDRGAPHYHLLAWGCEEEKLKKWIPLAWYEIAGGGDLKHLGFHQGKLGNGNVHCVQKVRSFRGVASYASKYLGKTFEVSGWGDKWTGRFWGVINSENIPFGELIMREIEYAHAVKVMRLQRRFAGIKKHKARRSQTTFCDADQWVERLLVQPGSVPGADVRSTGTNRSGPGQVIHRIK